MRHTPPATILSLPLPLSLPSLLLWFSQPVCCCLCSAFASVWCDPSAVCAQAFLLREAEAMVGEPDPNRVMVWFTNRRTKYKKVHGVLPVREPNPAGAACSAGSSLLSLSAS